MVVLRVVYFFFYLRGCLMCFKGLFNGCVKVLFNDFFRGWLMDF